VDDRRSTAIGIDIGHLKDDAYAVPRLNTAYDVASNNVRAIRFDISDSASGDLFTVPQDDDFLTRHEAGAGALINKSLVLLRVQNRSDRKTMAFDLINSLAGCLRERITDQSVI